MKRYGEIIGSALSVILAMFALHATAATTDQDFDHNATASRLTDSMPQRRAKPATLVVYSRAPKKTARPVTLWARKSSPRRSPAITS